VGVTEAPDLTRARVANDEGDWSFGFVPEDAPDESPAAILDFLRRIP
jgi:hypothetical protein